MITNTEDALEYMVECTLATIGHMAYLKSRSKSEFERQISIAQTGANWISKDKGTKSKHGRVRKLFTEKITVRDLADRVRQEVAR